MLNRYPGVFTAGEIDSLSNLRGIPKGINNDLHLSQIRKEWDTFYDKHPKATRREILQHAQEIDKKFGGSFSPSVTGGGDGSVREMVHEQ